jgi:hypothetical protein
MAKKGPFRCSACGRTFAMAAHLGRHQSTVHAAKKPPARPVGSAKRRRSRRATARPRQVPLVGAARVTAQVGAYRDQLAAQRAELDAQLGVIDRALAVLGVVASSGTKRIAAVRRSRAARAGSLKSFIIRVLRGRVRPMRVKDITAAVRKAGYATKNKTLDKSVGNALAAMPEITRAARGQYRLRG